MTNTWRIKIDDDGLDEVVMAGAYVHLEDMGNAWCLIVENADQHINVTLPHGRKPAFIFEQFDPKEDE